MPTAHSLTVHVMVNKFKHVWKDFGRGGPFTVRFKLNNFKHVWCGASLYGEVQVELAGSRALYSGPDHGLLPEQNGRHD